MTWSRPYAVFLMIMIDFLCSQVASSMHEDDLLRDAVASNS